MKKWLFAGVLSIGVFASGVTIQAQASEATIAPKVYTAAVAKEVATITYQDLYKIFKIAELEDDGIQTTMDTKKGHFIVKMPIAALIDAEDDDSLKEAYAEYEKLFGKAAQLKFTPKGNSFYAEIYTAGQWVKFGEEEKAAFIAEIVGEDGFELRAGGNFKDTIGHWAESYIQVLYQAEIIGGITETTFDPNGKVTRGQLVAMVFRAAGFELDDDEDYTSSSYTDLTNFWGAKEVVILENQGVLSIFKGSQFEPNKAVTREEMAYVIGQFLELEGFDTDALQGNPTFKDVQKMNPEALKSINILQKLGIVEGEKGNFNPKGELTRAQFAKIFALALFELD